MNVFFYGLFMDQEILVAKRVVPASSQMGFINHYKLRIGNRATLFQKQGSRAYGILMDVDADDVRRLYSEASVFDYVPELVRVETLDGLSLNATCYNLPLEKVTGTNKAYAQSLLSLATKLQLPNSYLAEIASTGN